MRLLPLLSSLAEGLVALGDASVAVVDLGCAFPGWAAEVLSTSTPEKRQGIQGRWVRGTEIVLLAPAVVPAAGQSAQALRRVLEYASSRVSRVLVDLSTLRSVGEDLTALHLLDGAFTVAQARRTHEQELLTLARDIPPHQDLGVLLADL
jgi:hypothetical protein